MNTIAMVPGGRRGFGSSAAPCAALPRHGALAALSVLLAACMLLGGCSLSRYDQLQRKSSEVRENLREERSRVLKLDADDPVRMSRLDHLTSLNAGLSAANVGLSSVKNVIPDGERDVWYDILEEVYDTIDWNIPLSPSDPRARPLPQSFTNDMLKLGGTSTPLMNSQTPTRPAE